MNDLVSIVMPSFNTASFINETIESVINQTYTNWELIIVDDCSTDHTKEVIQTLLNDKRIKYLENKKNSGAAVSRNRAIREAKGKWIAFLDSDDLWESNKLEKQIRFMEDNSIDFSYTCYREIDENNNMISRMIYGPKRISKILMYCYCWPGCLTVMYNQEKIGKIQIEDLKKNNDYALWLKIIKKSDCHLLDECLGSYRKRTGSISNHSKIKLIKYHYYLFKNGEKMNSFLSLLLTLNNIMFGVFKKIRYKSR